MICGSCGAENREGRKFCVQCGAGLARGCPSCGTPYEPGERFCGECGAQLNAETPADLGLSPRATAPAAERRLVSVLFADLVGFTTSSEGRDAEETRELLSRYFETARTIVERYGGTVEKFIGDAVMAVWGTPVAQEDDAERAVRAALDLVGAVIELDPALQARAGVLTGEAAVTLGAEGQGMVAGDLVNTASRIQSAAEPGTVLVGETTKRASEAAVAYEEAGERELKGKTAPVPVWRALRVVAGARGSMRSTGLEAPFVGRGRELRLVKEVFHASADERRAQLVSVVGIAGIGKTRLSWEFEKYLDGLAKDTWWHRGRCLSYGEGVAYWALAEMVRMRCEIVEEEEPASALGKLHGAVAEYIPDEDERRWVGPRLAHLLGLEEGTPGDQENLFSAWRILFERLAERDPVVLVFEDMQWADEGLLDFIEYLLDWSRSHPIFVLALARPELAEKRPSWGAGKRSFTSLYLEPLPPDAMEELLVRLVPGLPDDLRGRILERAEGVPLYAVETVRMLLDRGLLTQEGNIYRPSGPVETLEVPETLHALVAARLDSLTADERRLVQDGSVLGKTFTKQGLAALTQSSESEVEPLLAALVRKEVLSIQADPRSPERGQYAFLQDIVKRVAYETLSKKERKARHLAAATFLASIGGAEEDEIAEVVAAHYLDAHAAVPDAPDAGEIKEQARTMLVRAAERAASLGANVEAQRAFVRAAELSDDPTVEAELHERAGLMAHTGGRPEEAIALFERSIALFEAHGATHPVARVSARLAETTWASGRHEQALAVMNRSYEVLASEEPDEDLAALAAQLGRFTFFGGDAELGLQRVEAALDIAEALLLPEVLAQALNTKAIIMLSAGRKQEGLALLRYSLDVALEHDRPSAALRGYFNLADSLGQVDRYEDAGQVVRDGLAFARRVGNRIQEWNFLGQLYPMFALGEWDEAMTMISELPEDRWADARQAHSTVAVVGARVETSRGRIEEAHLIVRRCTELENSADHQERAAYRCATANLLLVRGSAAEALAAAEEAFAVRELLGMSTEPVKEAFVTAVEAALELGDLAKADELLAVVEKLPVGRLPQFLRAHASRFRARIAGLRDDPAEAERQFKRATGLFREIVFPFFLAVTLLEQGEWLAAAKRTAEAEPPLVEASEIFGRLEAAPWLERVAQARRTAEMAARA
jgi:class 3 adenylate cyclase/tetratricopeptide (TPR) repeat protein